MERQVTSLWLPSQASAQRAAKRKSIFYSYLNLWPFVGVLLTLLVAFMDAPVGHGFAPVDLPSSFHGTAQPMARADDAITVYVTRDGRLYFRAQQVQSKSLPILIRSAIGEGAAKKVYLAVDSRARYRDAAMVVEQIGNAGIREICILAYKREE